RSKVADILNADADEIIFTSGGTESDNLGIKGVAYLNKDKIGSKGNHIITSSIEHPAVLATCGHLEKQGFNVKYLPVDKYGIIRIKDLEEAISKDTFLITIMYANNEIGTIEPINEIGRIAKKHDVLFHTDAVQAICKTPIDVSKSNIDLLSVSAHKIYGPKGVGALYIRNGVKIYPLAHGGGHEKGLRSSTYNTPGIVGLGKTCELGRTRLKENMAHLKNLRDKLIKDILKIDESYLNGHPEKRLVNNAHFRFTAIEGESLNMMLDEKGIASATGSACSSKKLQASHVLTAIGLKPEEAHGSLRLTLGKGNTDEDISYVASVLPDIVGKLRKMSPLWNK
ncbi:MAG: cysteine desulfurase family protein, partial [Candidatus Thermoplasmatota archaeon]|nr:cysteine desulfurase family protein [Candidatus Thermoplasmatota archaeon]